MSPQGCLAALFLAILVVWSLVVGGLVVAGWLGATVIEFVVAVVLNDVQAAREAAEAVVQALRSLGFGVLATIWAIGAGVIGLLWFAFARGRHATGTIVVEHEARSDAFETGTAFPRMKDVTPPRKHLPPAGRRDPD